MIQKSTAIETFKISFNFIRPSRKASFEGSYRRMHPCSLALQRRGDNTCPVLFPRVDSAYKCKSVGGYQ